MEVGLETKWPGVLSRRTLRVGSLTLWVVMVSLALAQNGACTESTASEGECLDDSVASEECTLLIVPRFYREKTLGREGETQKRPCSPEF